MLSLKRLAYFSCLLCVAHSLWAQQPALPADFKIGRIDLALEVVLVSDTQKKYSSVKVGEKIPGTPFYLRRLYRDSIEVDMPQANMAPSRFLISATDNGQVFLRPIQQQLTNEQRTEAQTIRAQTQPSQPIPPKK